MSNKLTENNYNWQKLCAAEDFSHPDFKHVLDNVFKKPASYHRKQWEFVVIYLNLLINKKINNNMTGASFGAGREPLIYLIGSEIKEFTATDLYVYNTGWQTAKIKEQQSCRDFVMEKAPRNLDVSNIKVEEMDMRELDFADNSLDFCYSSCAFEHIGHKADFVKHLQEVKRVLKEDGIYVMTTEYLFNHDTVRVEGNYKFDPNYMVELFKQSGLYPDAKFNASIEESFLNKTKMELSSIQGMSPSITNSLASTILEKQGVTYTSCCFVLRKSNKANIKLAQLENKKSAEFARKSSEKNIVKLYSQYQYLNPVSGLKKSAKTVMMDHLEYLTEDYNNHFEEIKIDSTNFLHTDFIYFGNHTCQFWLQVQCKQKVSFTVRLFEKPPLYVKGRKLVEKEKITCDAGEVNHLIGFNCKESRVYALAVSTKENLNSIDFKNVSIRVKIK